jgi:hypothetical protein
MQHPERIIQVKVLKSLKQRYPKIRFQTFAHVNLNWWMEKKYFKDKGDIFICIILLFICYLIDIICI